MSSNTLVVVPRTAGDNGHFDRQVAAFVAERDIDALMATEGVGSWIGKYRHWLEDTARREEPYSPGNPLPYLIQAYHKGPIIGIAERITDSQLHVIRAPQAGSRPGPDDALEVHPHAVEGIHVYIDGDPTSRESVLKRALIYNVLGRWACVDGLERPYFAFTLVSSTADEAYTKSVVRAGYRYILEEPLWVIREGGNGGPSDDPAERMRMFRFYDVPTNR